MEVKENKKITNLVIILLLVMILLIAIGGYFLYNNSQEQIKELKQTIENFEQKNNETEDKDESKVDENNSNETEDKTESNVDQNESNDTKDNVSGCSGTIDAVFYGELHKIEGQFTIDYKETLTLHSNGKYKKIVANSEGEVGTYQIKDGIISFSFEAPYGQGKKEYTRTISADCSTITDASSPELVLKRK